MAQRSTYVRYRILLWLTLAAALTYLTRNPLGVAESSIRTDLGLTLTQSGLLLGAFFWPYALLQIPSGWFSQRYGTRFSLTFFAVAWSLATLGMGLAPTLIEFVPETFVTSLPPGFVDLVYHRLLLGLPPVLILLILAQVLMGVAQAGAFPACCNSIGHWMPISERSFACGVLTAGMQVGAVAVAALTGILLTRMTWQWVFILYSIPGILWAMLFFIRFRNRPEEVSWLNRTELNIIRSASSGSTNSEETVEYTPPQKWNWIHLIDLVFLCGQQICRSAGYIFFATWLPTFLQSTRHLSVATSGSLQGVVLVGYLLGSVLGGVLVDWVWRKTGDLWLSRCGVGALSLGSCGLLLLGAWFVKEDWLAISLLTLCSFCAAFAGPAMFALTIEIGGDRVPEVFGLVNMTGNLATAACPVLIGKLFQELTDWNLILAIFAALYLLGAIFWLLVNPKRGASQKELALFEQALPSQVGT